MQKYIEREGKTLKVKVYYELGGFSYVHDKNITRGYYLSVVPVEVEIKDGIRMEKSTRFSGNAILLKEVKRKSEKAQLEAEEIAEEKLEDLIQQVLIKNS